MTPYPHYKPSGIPWMGPIPKHWEVKKLKYLAKILNGQDHKNVWDENGNYPVVGTGGEFGRANSFLHEGPSVILGRKGTIDKPQYFETPFWTVDTAYYTDIPAHTNPRFFYYCCTTIHFDLYKYGSAVPSMTQETLNQIQFAAPPLPEQTAIAQYLDEKTALLDKLIANKQQLITLLKEERTALINEAVNGQGKNWERKKLKYVANVVLGKMLTNEDKGGYSLKPYLRAANMQWLTVDVSSVKEMWFSSLELEKLRVKKDDLLVSEGGEVGRTCIWNDEIEECYIQNSVHKITFKEGLNPHFFLYQFYYLGSIGFFDSIVNRISIGHLTCEKLNDIQVYYPSKSEQDKIVQHIQTHTQRIDGAIAKIEKEIALLQEYKTALISEVVTGKVKVV